MIHGSTGYVAQQSWVMNASVKENIIFGHKWDARFYERTVHACALRDDLASLPDGDETEVGERGISLSGGQKARLTLARAVYARADIYLLDDCLSAVDQHVARHLIDNVLGPKGLLSGKTRVLATNSIPVLMEAQFIALIRDGRIVERGSYEQLIAMKGEIANLVRTSNNQEEEEPSTTAPGGADDSSSSIADDTAVSSGDEAEEAQSGLPQLAPTISRKGQARASSMSTLRRASTASFHGHRGKVTDEEGGRVTKGKEFSEQGKVKWDVYGEYAKMSNVLAVLVYLATLVGAQTAQVGE